MEKTDKQTTYKADTLASVKSAGIAYKGDIRVRKFRNKKLLQSQQFHNNGLPSLFKFLCYALAGDIIMNGNPAKIVLYSAPESIEDAFPNPATKLPTPEEIRIMFSDYNSADKGSLAYVKLKPITAPIMYSITPRVVRTYDMETGESEFTVKFQWDIPYSTIAATDAIYMVGLMPANPNIDSRNIDDLLAYYWCISDKGLWDPITVDSADLNYSLILDWEMSLSNVKPGSTNI